ncbi:MAG: hypothetical protein ACR2P2_05740 [Nakamurella sp.]
MDRAGPPAGRPGLPGGARPRHSEHRDAVDFDDIELAAVLRRRRDQLGISCLCTSLPFADALAPVVQILAGS